MIKLSEDVPLEQRRELLEEAVEQAIGLVELALSQLNAARASLSVESDEDEDAAYGEVVYVAAASNAVAASFGMAKAQAQIDELLLDSEELDREEE